ncbi:hypothetical protein B1759_03025 [Rubrivirga sp. SAORIC476]|uniref:hypothetical protein n=1 Tax=Rubrivirga sp. SAORIC476 TaxID=1961794 RepID=UPI000BA8D340|nr:hypothetical protein [Rubrivirga sp. SAORIC476]PAP80384.1 hypothetical protein B1759_03025 [Rubrivirga sp. SAORIC476]
MTDRQTDRLDMLRATLTVIDDHADAWAAIPVMARYRDDLSTAIDRVRDAAQRQADPASAVTAVKDQLRTHVRDAAWTLAAALQAWAADTDRPDVAAQADFSPSDLIQLRDAALADQSELIVDLARTHAPDLADYGVLPPEIDALDALDDQFADALSTPRAAIVARSRATAEIAIEIRNATRLLRASLDPMVARLTASSPDFAREYRTARIIIDRGITGDRSPDAPDM